MFYASVHNYFEDEGDRFAKMHKQVEWQRQTFEFSDGLMLLFPLERGGSEYVCSVSPAQKGSVWLSVCLPLFLICMN